MTTSHLADYLINADQYQLPLAREDYETIFDMLAEDDTAPEGTYGMQLVRAAVKLAAEDPYIISLKQLA